MSLLYSSHTGKPFILGCGSCYEKKCLLCKVLDTMNNDDIFYYDNGSLYFFAKRSTGWNLEVINYKDIHNSIFSNVNIDGLISIKKIGNPHIFLFRYETYSLIKLNNKLEFEAVGKIKEIYSAFNGATYHTIVQIDKSIYIYHSDELHKIIEIPSLIKTFGFISKNKIYCLFENGFGCYNLDNETIGELKKQKNVGYFITDGKCCYTKKNLIKVNTMVARNLNKMKNLSCHVFGQNITFAATHENYVDTYLLDDMLVIPVVSYLIQYKSYS